MRWHYGIATQQQSISGDRHWKNKAILCTHPHGLNNLVTHLIDVGVQVPGLKPRGKCCTCQLGDLQQITWSLLVLSFLFVKWGDYMLCHTVLRLKWTNVHIQKEKELLFALFAPLRVIFLVRNLHLSFLEHCLLDCPWLCRPSWLLCHWPLMKWGSLLPWGAPRSPSIPHWIGFPCRCSAVSFRHIFLPQPPFLFPSSTLSPWVSSVTWGLPTALTGPLTEAAQDPHAGHWLFLAM